MDLGLRDAVAVCAASSKGIGRAVAEGFAREGCCVLVNGRDPETVDRTVREIRETIRAEVDGFVGDLTTDAGCRGLIQCALDRFGAIHALFTNAGGPPSRPFEDLDDDDWQAAFDLTLMSAVRLIRTALPSLRQTTGAVVNLTSIAAKQPIPGLTLSNALRPAVMGLAKSLSNDLAAEGIRINDVAPGFIWTGRQEYLVGVRAEAAGKDAETVAAEATADIPMGRYGRPEEVAALAVFLASPAAAYITGTSTLVDGGLYRGLV